MERTFPDGPGAPDYWKRERASVKWLLVVLIAVVFTIELSLMAALRFFPLPPIATDLANAALLAVLLLPVCYLLVYQPMMLQIAMRKAHAEKLEHGALYDTLTGLPNRLLLKDRLRYALDLARREQRPLALVLLDLDRLKEINDTFGRRNGDLVLQQIGARLRAGLRKSDTVARLGGDEFVMLLPTVGLDLATVMAEKIQKTLQSPFVLGDMPVDVEASIGIALYPVHGEDPDTLLQRADGAMRVAKKNKEGVAIYQTERDPFSMRRLSLIAELRRAIDQGELALYYQPKIDMRTQQICGVEALVRWNHPQRGFLPPADFVPLAEQTGLIKPLTFWTLNEALLHCKQWDQNGPPLKTAVNLSARHLQDKSFPALVADSLDKWGVGAANLEMEITESAIMIDPVRAMGIVMQLKEIGIELSLDAFGTGYTSLSHLVKLPVYCIKIDRSFIQGIANGNHGAAIVRSVIDLGHNLGLKVIAEGVEDKQTWDALEDLGCDISQGHYLSQPLPAYEFNSWLAKSPWGTPQLH